VVIAPDSTPASLEQALALLGESRRQWDAEKRLLELRIQSLEHRLFGTKSEKVAFKDKQLALIDEVFTHPEPAATEDVVVVPDMGKRAAKKPVRKPLPEHLECVEISSGSLHLACSWTAKLSGKEGGGGE